MRPWCTALQRERGPVPLEALRRLASICLEVGQSASVRGVSRANTRDLRWMEATDPKVAPTSFTIIIRNYITLKAYILPSIVYISSYNIILSITKSFIFNYSDLTCIYTYLGAPRRSALIADDRSREATAIPNRVASGCTIDPQQSLLGHTRTSLPRQTPPGERTFQLRLLSDCAPHCPT